MAAFTPHALHSVPPPVTAETLLFGCRGAIGMMVTDSAVPFPRNVLRMAESYRSVQLFETLDSYRVGKVLGVDSRDEGRQQGE